MHIVQINAAYDPQIPSPDALLDRCRTLTGWSDALLAAGATRVTVVQRFRCDALHVRGGVEYRFRSGALDGDITALAPDVVHVNGMRFAPVARRIRRRLRPGIPIVLQDHFEAFHRDPIRRAWLRYGLRHADGFLFAARDLATPWLEAELISSRQPVYQVMEGSTFLHRGHSSADDDVAGAGDPAVLWVGRLIPRKDPLTVLRGFEAALRALPHARLKMVYSDATLLPDVRAHIAATPALARSVDLVGHVGYDQMPPYYRAADLFVLGSHTEGGNFAAVEAIACGALPVITDIPFFRVITQHGTRGQLWRAGDAEACARALVAGAHQVDRSVRESLTRYFEQELSWATVGRDAMAAYRDVIDRSA